ncbi:MAG: dTMP kinase [Deltaproteobacteria bacterium]|nr:dTMP kinase [Deltaproteobacteria bacterium]
MTGVFLTFEGGEGTGKTTQIERLAARLEALGRPVTRTREPGGTALGRTIRELLVRSSEDSPTPLAELFLYAADRAHHVETVVRPALEAGRVVLCDRYADATEAYQGHGRGLPLDVIRASNALATAGLRPDRTLLLDLEPRLGVARALGRAVPTGAAREERFEVEAASFHERVRRGYLAIAEQEPERVRVLDASGRQEEVAERVWGAVRDLFPERTAGGA